MSIPTTRVNRSEPPGRAVFLVAVFLGCSTPLPSDDLRRCEIDDDCMLTTTDCCCGTMAINIGKEAEWRAVISDYTCPNDGHWCSDPVPSCREHLCVSLDPWGQAETVPVQDGCEPQAK